MTDDERFRVIEAQIKALRDEVRHLAEIVSALLPTPSPKGPTR